MEAFLNPLTFIAGAALVSTPIIIHLINRIRFRRVKWAAMEFLLKAQKRMRRRKILEQLLLLLLRCLLVFLVGVLFARFVGCGTQSGQETRPTSHVVVLDDTPSMADGWRREDGAQTDAFAEAKRLVYEKLMPAAAEATTAQTLHLVRLSDADRPFPAAAKVVESKLVPKPPEEVRAESRVGTKSIAAMEEYLKPLQVSTVRRSVLVGLRKAKELLDQAPPEDARVVHVLSDLRAVDWAKDGQAVGDLLREFKDAGVAVHFIDVAHPPRKPDRKSPPYSDNVGIVEVKPRSRTVSVNQPTDIEVRVKNFGGTDLRDVGLSFYLNGQGNVITSVPIPYLAANQEQTVVATVRFPEAGAADKAKLGPLARFRLVTAALSAPEVGGIAADNARHTVVEVRDALKVLVVDGRTVENGVDLRESARGDSAFLRTMLASQRSDDEQYLGNIEVVSGEFGKLDKTDLRPYSAVYLMNVPTLSAAAVKNVERFVADGGGVGVFLGPNVKPDEYNKLLYRGGAGFFPVPLQPEPSREMTAEEKLVRGLAFNPRLMLRRPANRTHPALWSIYNDARGQPTKDNKIEQQFRLPIFEHYWPVNRLGARRDDKAVQELYCLPNEASIASFQQRAEDLVAAVKKRENEPKFDKARKYLDPLLEKIRRTPAETKPLSEARLLDELLCDQINLGDASEPVLREFWSQPEVADLKRTAAELRDATKYGDPLYLVKQFERGRVAVMTTDAGGRYSGDSQWNNWPSIGGAGWSIVVSQMQKYLAGGGGGANRSVGDSFTAEFDFARYEPTVRLTLLTADASKPSTERKLPWEAKPLGQLTMDKAAKPKDAALDAAEPPFRLRYADATAPGVYVFTLTRKPPAVVVGAPAARPDPLGDLDFVAVPFNIDALSEGDLRRETTDELLKNTNKAPLHNTEDLSWLDDFKQKPSDLSSRRWLYLLILLVLVAEQAWAVRISYHTKPDDLDTLAPSAAAAYAHHTTLTPASAGEPAAPA